MDCLHIVMFRSKLIKNYFPNKSCKCYLKNTTSYLVKEIMINRIRITGLSEDEFWKSDEIRDGYQESAMLANLYDQLA